MQDVTKYPVNMVEMSQDRFIATLVDLPDGPKGQGNSALAAYNDLAARVIPVLTDMMLEGNAPAATDSSETDLVIGLSPPVKVGTPGS